eukprot:sb/3477385/
MLPIFYQPGYQVVGWHIVKSLWTVGTWNRDTIREDKRESLMGEKEMYPCSFTSKCRVQRQVSSFPYSRHFSGPAADLLCVCERARRSRKRARAHARDAIHGIPARYHF